MTEATAPKKQFSIQKLYVKDVSFESPGTPHSFSYKQWNPKVDLNLTNSHTQVEGDIYPMKTKRPFWSRFNRRVCSQSVDSRTRRKTT